ncbi:MAG: N-acetyltransferase [Rhodothermales bacterium]|nr:N-acetyltransferase [Rhodothermales bacterium]
MRVDRVHIRPERETDFEAVRRVNVAAFGQVDEADLVDRLRANLDVYQSLVAEIGSSVIGHIFFSPMTFEHDMGDPIVWGLAPMAVHPDHQNSGVGSGLVRRGLEACTAKGVQAVFVLGHPQYYPRFGFRQAVEWGVQSEFDVPAEVFLAVELTPGALDKVSGVVRYHPLFESDV